MTRKGAKGVHAHSCCFLSGSVLLAAKADTKKQLEAELAPGPSRVLYLSCHQSEFDGSFHWQFYKTIDLRKKRAYASFVLFKLLASTTHNSINYSQFPEL